MRERDRPNCYNRPPFKEIVTVQDGWFTPVASFAGPFLTRSPRMKVIPDPMSKGCHQHGPMGEATLHGWDCDGCRWKPEAQNAKVSEGENER